MKLQRIYFFFFFLVFHGALFAQAYVFPNDPWVNSVYESLSPEQRIAQLMMVAAYSDPAQNNEKELLALINRYQIGGLIFFKGSPERQVNMQNRLQNASPIPLLIGMDAEWGLNMRLDSTIRFPRQMALAAFNNDSLVYEMGREIGRQCKRMGIHVNFAPVIDVNNNPNNPVINDRSFGENKHAVSKMGLAYMRGLQDEGVMACIKHFPGHGDTETDSHLDLPVIRFPYERLDSLELFPFRYLIDSGAMSIMTAHLYVTTLDPMPKQASSLSKRIVRSKLIDSLGFRGLIFTDALNMKGVSRYYKSGELEVRALYAGNDVLVFPENIPAAIMQIQLALDSCLIDSNEFEVSVKKVLAAKLALGLKHYEPVSTQSLLDDLNSGKAKLLLDELSYKSLTLVERKKKHIPLKAGKKIACVAIGDVKGNAFQEAMNRYGQYDFFGIKRDAPVIEFSQLLQYLKQEDYDVVVISLHNTNRLKTKMYGLSEQGVQLVKDIDKFTDVILVSFGIPYNLQYFKGLENILVAYQDLDINMEKAAAALHGATPIIGKLPVTVSKEWPYHHGVTVTSDTTILRYSLPEKVGLRSEDFKKVDSIVMAGIDGGAFPGCQVLVAKDGEVIYSKAFGYFSFDGKEKVTTSSIYDIASISKIAGTTLAIMHLFDHGKIDLDKKASYYLKELKKTNKQNLTLRQLLSHTAGLQAWIPFYKNTLHPEIYQSLYSSCTDNEYTIPVADGMFAHHSLKDSLWKWVIESPMGKSNEYKYSDLGFFILQKIVEQESGMTLDAYLKKHYFDPLNLANTAYRPSLYFEKERLVPTELDTVFRKQHIRGHVHDPAAAMLGGVAGNAGMFSNANDLAVLMQLLLNKGVYHNQRILKESTIEVFTDYSNLEFCRRGLGFDKPELDPKKGKPSSKYCSSASYGHSGFTGTFIWADPTNDLIYVFLSNRVNPDASNNKISQWNIRTNIQDLLYEFINEAEEKK